MIQTQSKEKYPEGIQVWKNTFLLAEDREMGLIRAQKQLNPSAGANAQSGKEWAPGSKRQIGGRKGLPRKS